MAGLELLYGSVYSTIGSQNDAVVCCLHWSLITSGFKCSGSGEQATAASVKLTELLPGDWNKAQDAYCLCYRHLKSGDDYLLKVVVVGTELLVHLLRRRDEKVSNMTIESSQYATEDLSSFHSAYRHLEQLQQRIRRELLDAFTSPPASPAGRSSKKSEQRRPEAERPRGDDPLRVPPPHGERMPPIGADTDPDGLYGIGRGDLDPLRAGAGGGMVYDPLRTGPPIGGIDPSAGLPHRLPPGAVPPGARFDPFGPPDLDRGRNPRAGPDPDHLPPPGADDMFM